MGADYDVIANSMTGFFEFEKGDRSPGIPDFNVFFRYNATYPFYSDAIWYLTQMRRWGQIAEAKPDSGISTAAKSVYKPEIYLEAARLLVDEGLANEADFPWDSDGFKARRRPTDIIDGIAYDGKAPNAYLDSLPIGLKGDQKVVVEGESPTGWAGLTALQQSGPNGAKQSGTQACAARGHTGVTLRAPLHPYDRRSAA